MSHFYDPDEKIVREKICVITCGAKITRVLYLHWNYMGIMSGGYVSIYVIWIKYCWRCIYIDRQNYTYTMPEKKNRKIWRKKAQTTISGFLIKYTGGSFHSPYTRTTNSYSCDNCSHPSSKLPETCALCITVHSGKRKMYLSEYGRDSIGR